MSIEIDVPLEKAREMYCTVLRTHNFLHEAAMENNPAKMGVYIGNMEMALSRVANVLPKAVTHDDDGNPLTGNEVPKPPGP